MHCEEFLHPPIKPVILYIAGHPVSLNKIITIHEKAKVLYKTKYNDYFGENIHPLLQTLQTALLDLLYELKDTDIQLIIGGGYGIYLKADYVPEGRCEAFCRIGLSRVPPTTLTCFFARSCLWTHPYTFSMMKLFAFKDRLDDAEKEFGRYHTLDLYTIMATTTEKEWGNCF